MVSKTPVNIEHPRELLFIWVILINIYSKELKPGKVKIFMTSKNKNKFIIC